MEIRKRKGKQVRRLAVTEQQHQEDLQRLRGLRPIDDDFMRCLFKDNIPLAEFVLRIITDKTDLIITDCETQKDMKRLAGARSICLDAYGVDSMGKKYDLEIQRADKGADPHRARYHSSVLDIENLDAGQQMELMEREEQDGADALVVVPADEGQVAGKQMTIPVILLRSGLTQGAVTGNIIIDYEKMGGQLAKEMLKDIPEDASVFLLVDREKQSRADILFLKGAGTVFTGKGRSIEMIAKNGDDGGKVPLESLSKRTEKKAVVLAQNQEILTEAAGVLANSPEWIRAANDPVQKFAEFTCINIVDAVKVDITMVNPEAIATLGMLKNRLETFVELSDAEAPAVGTRVHLRVLEQVETWADAPAAKTTRAKKGAK